MVKKRDFNTAGTTFARRQNYLAHLAVSGKHYSVRLIREASNKKDSNAIKVMAFTEDKKRLPVGYVPRALAAEIAPVMDQGNYVYVNEVQIVGGHGYSYGMKINVGWYA